MRGPFCGFNGLARNFLLQQSVSKDTFRRPGMTIAIIPGVVISGIGAESAVEVQHCAKENLDVFFDTGVWLRQELSIVVEYTLSRIGVFKTNCRSVRDKGCR